MDDGESDEGWNSAASVSVGGGCAVLKWALHLGSALDVLKTLPDESVHCIVTSPPYYGLRDYGVDGQIGLEPTPEAYVAQLVEVFREVRRVLRDDGTLWLNLGDSYTGSANAGGEATRTCDNAPNARDRNLPSKRGAGLKPKDLIGIPWAVAFAMRADGWYLRADIIWQKPNTMPESVRDRVTKSHEYVFLLTKCARYFYDADAIREVSAPSTPREFDVLYEDKEWKDSKGAGAQNASSLKSRIVNDRKKNYKTARIPGQSPHGYTFRDDGRGSMAAPGSANARSVWTIPTQPSTYDHFALMPKALARKCIMAGCPQGGTVLDPFAGMATTGVVALEEGRNFVGIELNPNYHAAARQRLAGVAPLLSVEEPVSERAG